MTYHVYADVHSVRGSTLLNATLGPKQYMNILEYTISKMGAIYLTFLLCVYLHRISLPKE